MLSGDRKKEGIGYDSDDYDLGVALTKEGPLFHQWYGPHSGLLAGSEFVVVRDEAKKKTFYEIRIPFTYLSISPKEGAVFGFNFAVFDDDTGSGQKHWMQLTRGITSGKNPSLFKKFVLVY